MPKQADPLVRTKLVEHAAALLARRDPVTLRGLAAGAGTSTMAVYTHFGGMAGLWSAVRQEGFTRLAERLGDVGHTRDPVRDLVALGAAYVDHALANPDLYRVMFDAGFDLEDPAGADGAFLPLVRSAAAGVERGRFAPETDPAVLATRWWAVGHGLTSLVVSGVLPLPTLVADVPALANAVFVAAGDTEVRCRRSVKAGWAAFTAAHGG